MSFGARTWQNVSFTDPFPARKRNRIVGLSFPEQNRNLGLEPSILTVLPEGENVEFSLINRDFNDADVTTYLCSVYISGFAEFKDWASRHDVEKIIVGGYHPTSFPEDFPRYASRIVRGPCDDIQETLEQEGQVIAGISKGEHLPRRDLYDISLNQQVIPDKRPKDVVVSINTSIGCYRKKPCDFCCTPIMCPSLLQRPTKTVEKEAGSLVHYSPRFCFIRDENFTQQRDWKERLEIIHRALSETRLYLFASADTFKEDTAAIFARNGVYMVCLGLEDPTVEYAKNRKLDQVVGDLKKAGIMVYLSYIVDPLKVIGQEAARDFYSILMTRIRELAPEMICGNFLMPFPGTALWDKYYAHVSPEDYVHYDSKTPFLIRNPVVREKMKFFLFWYQWQYYASNFYRDNVRKFFTGDTLHLRFRELYDHFRVIGECYWDRRA